MLQKKKRLAEKRQKQEIRAKIAAAKEERMKKAGLIHVVAPADTKPKSKPQQTKQVEKKYDSCSLAIRMPSGETVKHDFQPTDTLQSVYDYLKSTQGLVRDFTINNNYPRRAYEGDSLKITLKDAGKYFSAFTKIFIFI